MLREMCCVVALLAGSARVAWTQSDAEPVVSADDLFADPEAMTDGTNVRLEDGIVRAKTGNIVRVSFGRHQIFVVPADPSSLEFLAIGAHVSVQGTLRQAPSAPQARLTYAMRPSEARRLARTRFYVDAWSVVPAS